MIGVMCLMVEAEGYLLRIATQQWVEQVFSMAIYYTGLLRKWKQGPAVLFMHRTSFGDAIVGHGVIESVYDKEELSEEEKFECGKHGWKKALEFKYVKEFEKPLPVKATFLKDSKFRGRYFQGLRITEEQVNAIIREAERM